MRKPIKPQGPILGANFRNSNEKGFKVPIKAKLSYTNTQRFKRIKEI